MGADITWETKDGKEWYFRDSYNPSNLAWIIGLSYWKDGKTLKDRKAFFKKMSEITDEQIEVHMSKKFAEGGLGGTLKEWLKTMKGKRDDIVKNMPLIKKAVIVRWSV